MRKDIQGLRAIAVWAVLLYHFWPMYIAGGYVGVDIFFVISGFLITLHLLKKPPHTFHMLTDFWSKRIKRLLPAACLVLLFTLLVGSFVMPSTMRQSLVTETASAAVYVENWTLSNKATNYLESEDAPSPIQHFWSLSVEEQFYLVWPILIGGSFLVGRYLKKDYKNILWWSLLGLFVLSLAYSVYLTYENRAAAYFVTPTRMWELALGGLTAYASFFWQKKKLTDRLARPMAWIGLGMIVSSVFLFTDNTFFPGYTALLPTLGTALVIFANIDDVRWSPSRLLSLRYSQYFGDISYSLYLWHWPLFILAPYVLGFTPRASVKILLIIIAVLLSALMKKYVEDYVRFHSRLNRRKRFTYSYGLSSIAIVLVAGFTVLQVTNSTFATSNSSTQKILSEGGKCMGAAAMRNSKCNIQDSSLITSPVYAKHDKSVLYKDDCWSNRPFTRHRICTYGDKTSKVRIALIGNSHAGMWQPAIAKVVDNEGYRLDTFLVSECYTVEQLLGFGNGELADNCVLWNKWALDSIMNGNFDLVIISDATHVPLKNVPNSKQIDSQRQAYSKTLDKLINAKTKTLVVRDDPEGIRNIPDCIAENYNDQSKCNNPRNKALKPDPLFEAAIQAESKSPFIHSLDLTNLMCDKATCYASIGGVIAYFDYGHLSRSFTQTLEPEFDKAIADSLH